MQRIFLTGASSGIGRAVAERLCADGHQVWGTSRDTQRLPKISGMHPVALDLSDHESISKSFSAALADAGHFDVVINNAGDIGYFGPTESVSAQTLHAQFQTLVFAHMELCRLALAAMRSHGSGRVINVTSLAARLPVPFQGPYNAAKAAMASFTLTMQVELEGSDIRVIDVQPGDIHHTKLHEAIATIPKSDGPHAGRMERVWRVADRNIKSAPGPEVVARRVSNLIDATNPPPRVTVGSFFEASVATFIFRLLPQRVRIWGLKKYYRL